MGIPKSMQGRYEQIALLISDFCRLYLNDDYETLCLRLLEKLCRKRPSPLLSGRANTWAAGIVYAIAANNYIFDKSQPIHMTADELSAPFGLAKSTVANKAAEISRLCDVSQFDANWLLPHLVDSSPGIWFLEVNGLLMDIRTAPLELQIAAYERGLIPYVPALKKAEEEPVAAKAADARPEPEPEKNPESPETTSSTPDTEDFSDIYQTFRTE